MISFVQGKTPSYLLIIGMWDTVKWDTIFSIPFSSYSSANEYMNEFISSSSGYHYTGDGGENYVCDLKGTIISI